MTAELAINPWKYFTVYGHFALDEFSTPYEEDRGGGGGPPVYGYLLGARGAYPLGPGYLDLVVEGAQTSPWLYNRRAAPYYYNVRRYWSVVTENTEYITKPLGYEYGPDAIVFFLAASYRVPESFGVELEVERILKGEKDVGAPWDPAPGDLPPTGVPEKKWVVHLGGSWTPFSYVQVGAAINWSHTDNPLHLEGESRSDAEVTAYVNVGL